MEDGGWKEAILREGRWGRRLPLPQAVTSQFPEPVNTLSDTADETEGLRILGLGPSWIIRVNPR